MLLKKCFIICLQKVWSWMELRWLKSLLQFVLCCTLPFHNFVLFAAFGTALLKFILNSFKIFLNAKNVEPSWAELSRAEPSWAEPSRTEPSCTDPSRTEPNRAKPSRAQPSRIEPIQAEPSRTQPNWAEAKWAILSRLKFKPARLGSASHSFFNCPLFKQFKPV